MEAAPQYKEIREQKQEALTAVIEQLPGRVEGEAKRNSFVANGREYPLTDPADCIVANAQALKRATEGILLEARHSGDYRHEQAAAKLSALSEKNEELAILAAEIYTYDPNALDALEHYIPGLVAHREQGTATWGTLQSAQ